MASFLFPYLPTASKKRLFGGWALVANAKGKNRDEAAKFCIWAVGSMQQRPNEVI
jgi:multiple sugar transport system substrate-binding protein